MICLAYGQVVFFGRLLLNGAATEGALPALCDVTSDPAALALVMHESVADWLTSIKMDAYIERFRQHGIDTMECVSLLTLENLLSMQITLAGHQKKILSSAHTLRQQLITAHMTDGFLV